MTILVTGGAGFIGSNLVGLLRHRFPDETVVTLDNLTYAGNVQNLRDVWSDPLHTFVKGDITDPHIVEEIFESHDIRGVFHLAAESHVDRSIVGPMAFVKTNVEGTAVLLRAAQHAWEGREDDVRFIHVSTDEVFGSLGPEGAFTENTPYSPRSPYSASKASSDHLARAWHETYGLPVIVTNCTNNYGPFQFPEKLLPVVITRAVAGEPVPVYGAGDNIRDWLYVTDHCEALIEVYDKGRVGETYCIGGECELRNLSLVERLLDATDEALERESGESRKLIQFVTDRPGHDFRYAMDISKIRSELGWSPKVNIEEGLRATVRWYLDNQEWCQQVQGGESRTFEKEWYGSRLDHATPPPDSSPVKKAHLITDEISRDEIRERLDRSGALSRIGVTNTYETVSTPVPGLAVARPPADTPINGLDSTTTED
jgi:dTDP-glucose 4,6-dehydratase